MFIIIGCTVFILLLIIGVILVYNRLQQLSVKVEEAASGIDVALEKRWDLLNELLAAVKKYLSMHNFVPTVAPPKRRSQKRTPLPHPKTFPPNPHNSRLPGHPSPRKAKRCCCWFWAL